jgi:hypothetical protein
MTLILSRLYFNCWVCPVFFLVQRLPASRIYNLIASFR